MKVDAKQLAGIVPVANGGTGASDAATARSNIGAAAPTDTVSKATSLAGGAAGNLVYQSAAGTTAYVSNGTAGQLLQSNGASAPSYVTFSGGFSNIAVITTVGTTNWTVPAGITKCKVTVVGGGGGGATATAGCGYWYTGWGGAGAGTAIKFISGLTPGASISCTVGAGGTPANSGNTSSFGAHCSASGGGGGGGTDGVGTGGDLNLKGGRPLMGGSYRQTAHLSSFGGSSFLAGITYRGIAAGYGGGGGGGTDGVGVSGDAGGNGIIIIEY